MPRARRAISLAPSATKPDAEHARAARHDLDELSIRVERKPERDAEALAQGCGDAAGARGGAHEREGLQIDPHRARGRPLADDEVELEVLHGGIEDLLDRGVQAVDLVDEEYVVPLEVGEKGREIARARDHRPRGGAETDAELARDDLGEGRLAQAGRAKEQHVVERLAARAGRRDEDAEVGAHLGLADELGEGVRTQRGLGDVLLGKAAFHHALVGGDRRGHWLSSLSPAFTSASKPACWPRRRWTSTTTPKASARR